MNRYLIHHFEYVPAERAFVCAPLVFGGWWGDCAGCGMRVTELEIEWRADGQLPAVTLINPTLDFIANERISGGARLK